MNDTRLHTHLARYTNRPTLHWAANLIDQLRMTPTITQDDSYRIFHDTLGLPYDADIKAALDAVPVLDHPSVRMVR